MSLRLINQLNDRLLLGVQRITKLTVWFGSRFLSHGSDHFRINNNKKDNKTNVTLNKIFKCVKPNKVKNLVRNLLPLSIVNIKNKVHIKSNQNKVQSEALFLLLFNMDSK